jgi:hypothetical protein
MMVASIQANGEAIEFLSKPRFWNMGIGTPARTIASGLNMNNVAEAKIHAAIL